MVKPTRSTKTEGKYPMAIPPPVERAPPGPSPSCEPAGRLRFYLGVLPILRRKQVEGPVFVILAPLRFVGLQYFADPVAVTLVGREETALISFLFSTSFKPFGTAQTELRRNVGLGSPCFRPTRPLLRNLKAPSLQHLVIVNGF